MTRYATQKRLPATMMDSDRLLGKSRRGYKHVIWEAREREADNELREYLMGDVSLDSGSSHHQHTGRE